MYNWMYKISCNGSLSPLKNANDVSYYLVYWKRILPNNLRGSGTHYANEQYIVTL